MDKVVLKMYTIRVSRAPRGILRVKRELTIENARILKSLGISWENNMFQRMYKVVLKIPREWTWTQRRKR